MIHHRQRLPLGLEPRHHLLGVHAQLDDLEGHFAADRLLLFGDIDHAAAALPDLLQQLVATERLAHGFVRRIGQFQLHRRLGSGFVLRRQFIRRVMGDEQGVEALAQGVIAEAGPIQEGGAFRTGQLDGGLKQGFLAVLG